MKPLKINECIRKFITKILPTRHDVDDFVLLLGIVGIIWFIVILFR